MSLEQYYTDEVIGERLVAMLPCNTPKNCVELSAGQGALLRPIIKKWPKIRISTCELDPVNNLYLRNNFRGDHHQIDVISESFDEIYKDRLYSFDLAVCNPPFSWRSNSEYDKSSLGDFGTTWMRNWSRVRSECLFIIQNLKLLNDEGYLAVILPELIIFSDSFSQFRKHLSGITSVVAISELPTGSFKGTEAKTFILVLSKKHDINPFSLTDQNGNISMHSQNEFHSWATKTTKHPNFSLAKSTFELKRGKHSGKELRAGSLSYYHTSGFCERNPHNVFGSSAECKLPHNSSFLLASPGHILINRVGTRTLGKAVVVKDGHYIVSDCVFRLSLPSYIDPHDIIDFWHNHAEEIIQNARGTCAQYITKVDILNHLAHFLEIQTGNSVYQSSFAVA